MKYTKFIIKNFKGINEVTFDLSKSPEGKIYPLVGLNESGKTTILEAINLFQQGIKSEFEHEMIHKSKKGNFSGKVSVEAFLELDDEDKKVIKSFLDKESLQLEKEILNCSVTKSYEFKDSKFISNGFQSTWSIDINVKTSRAKKFESLHKKNTEKWQELVSILKDKQFPKILYFENFIFDFPNKIYLEEVANDALTQTEIQKEYRNVIKDVLSSIDGKSYDLNTHLLSRIKDQSEENKEAVKQTINDMAKKLNDTIIKSWQEIFPKSPKKSIEIELENDASKYYLQFKIKQGASSFYINERSLGFRWFFGFLLFTEFRKRRNNENGEYLFLFDEPASNLHQKSQQKLLELFEKLTEGSKIIYSTHSPYLLNPKFLLTSFVIKDEGRKDDVEIDFESYKQDIKAILYRTFVGNTSNEITHFQPLLDCLEFIENPFEQTTPLAFFEGKSDYYTFKWIMNTQFVDANYTFNLYPGAGVTTYVNIFREHLAHDKKFIGVFDADKAGKDAKKDYLKKISMELEKNIFTLKEVDNTFDTFQTEKMFTSTERLDIQKLSFPDDTSYSKGHFNTAIQELFIKNETFELSQDTKDNFKKVFDFIVTKLEELD
jgi:predicted ATPase